MQQASRQSFYERFVAFTCPLSVPPVLTPKQPSATDMGMRMSECGVSTASQDLRLHDGKGIV